MVMQEVYYPTFQRTISFTRCEAAFEQTDFDLKDVKGQKAAKRALEIAAAGGHHMLMIGPPGSGKSMMAKRMTSILPPITPEEALYTTMIYSIAGMLDETGLITKRPFREPHHSASIAALVGGGRKVKPGEILIFYNNSSIPGSENGLQRRIRLNPTHKPLKAPYFSTACLVYSEQVG